MSGVVARGGQDLLVAAPSHRGRFVVADHSGVLRLVWCRKRSRAVGGSRLLLPTGQRELSGVVARGGQELLVATPGHRV